MNRLQKALAINAVFSGISGIIISIMHKQIAHIFGLQDVSLFLVTGLVLIYFAFSIVLEIKKQRRSFIIWIIVQDVLWVIGSLIIILFKPAQITKTGELTIEIIALIVLIMAINQAIALKKAK